MKKFRDVVQDFVREAFRLSPSSATYMGIHDHDDSLESFSRDSRQEAARMLKHYAALHSKIDAKKLDDDGYTDYHLMGSELFVRRLHLEETRDWERDPALYPGAVLESAYHLLNGKPSARRGESLLSRMRQFPRLLGEARENIKNPPKLFCQSAIEVTEGGMEFFRNLRIDALTLPQKLKKELEAGRLNAVRGLDDYGRWVKEKLLPRAGGDFAVGRGAFDRLLKKYHLLPYDADGLKEIGEEALRRTEKRLKEMAGRIDRTKSWKDLLRESAEKHPSAQKLVETYGKEMARTRKFILEKNLAPMPRVDSLVVNETPPFFRMFLPFAAYMPPPLFQPKGDAEFWVTPVPTGISKSETQARLKEHAFHKIPVIVLHETYPGHHLQFSFLREVSSPLVKCAFAACEGWALYCEEMMREEGFFDNPVSELSQRRDELWRIIRVILDVGLHTGKMKPEKAVKFLSEKAQMPEAMAWGEVKRYARDATQPMSYYIGKMEIMRLRDEYRKKVKDRFRLFDFHTGLLKCGPVPVKLAARKMLGKG